MAIGSIAATAQMKQTPNVEPPKAIRGFPRAGERRMGKNG